MTEMTPAQELAAAAEILRQHPQFLLPVCPDVQTWKAIDTAPLADWLTDAVDEYGEVDPSALAFARAINSAAN